MKKSIAPFVIGIVCGAVAASAAVFQVTSASDHKNTTKACLDLATYNMVLHHGKPQEDRIRAEQWYALRGKMQADCVASMQVFKLTE